MDLEGLTHGLERLTLLEKVGTAVGFIPGLGFFSGIIMSFIYMRRAEGKTKEADKVAVTKTAEKTKLISDQNLKLVSEQNLIGNQKIDVSKEKRECYKKLCTYSMGEAIMAPVAGLNVLPAFASLDSLRKLSYLRGVNDSAKTQKEYLFKKYRIENMEDQSDTLAALLMIISQFDASKYARYGFKHILVKDCMEYVKEGGGQFLAPSEALQELLKLKIEKTGEEIKKQVGEGVAPIKASSDLKDYLTAARQLKSVLAS